MKIGFITSYSSKHPAGLERSTLKIIESIVTQDNTQNEYIIYTKMDSGLAGDLGHVKKNNFKIIEIGFGKMWKAVGLFFAPKADIYIFNGHEVPLFFRPKNYGVIVYDFAYKNFVSKNLAQTIKNKFSDFLARLAFKRAKKILAISNATKKEIINFFNIDANKIKIMYLGLNDNIALTTPKNPGVTDDGFFLFPGTVKERKNVLNAVKAYALFRQQNKQANNKLVIAGTYSKESDYVQKIFSFIKDNNLEKDVIFIGWTNDNGLAYLYQKASALIFPSILEGFGMPVLEAMQFGTPVITSNVSSLGEVAGDAALLVDPYDIEKMAQAMQKIVYDPKLRENLIVKGFERMKKFTWANSAEQFFQIINNF